MKKILNLYAGIGGNRKLWGDDYDITAVEFDPEIAAVYKKLYPKDNTIVGDAHEYLISNYQDYDFIWSSPPCQSHSKMAKATRHKSRKYPDMKLYQEILFLQHHYDGDWVVENVKPFYTPLIEPTSVVGRHLFWSNRDFIAYDEKSPKGFINKSNMESKQELMDWLGIHFKEKLYYTGNHCPCQVLRNCVHPNIGKSIIDSILHNIEPKQQGLFA